MQKFKKYFEENKKQVAISVGVLSLSLLAGGLYYNKKKSRQGIAIENNNKEPNRNLIKYLTQSDAIGRSASITENVFYDLVLSCPENSKNYFGLVKIKFKSNVENNIKIDFQGEKIIKMILNGKKILSKNNYQDYYNGAFIQIPKGFIFFFLKKKFYN